MKCWDILQKLLESYSVIRADVNPFGALSVTSNSGDRSSNLLLSQAKDHKRNCCSLCLLNVKNCVRRHQVAAKAARLTEGVTVWPFLSLDVLVSPVHHVIPQLWTAAGRRTRGHGRRGEEGAVPAWADARRSVCSCGCLPQKELLE